MFEQYPLERGQALAPVRSRAASLQWTSPPYEVWRPKSLDPTRNTAARELLDLNYGRGVLVGNVRKKSDPVNVPLHRRVRLYRDYDGRLIAQTWSDPVTGQYEFRSLVLNDPYTVVSHDYEHNFRAAIADNLLATLP